MTQRSFWQGRRVFLTGHTGFKGTWLTHMLAAEGAIVCGYALAPETTPSMFELTQAHEQIDTHNIGNVCDAANVSRCLSKFAPDLVIHMAAQPLVRASYEDPSTTWHTNVMGTVNVLDAVRASDTTRAALIVTTDKCYENNSWHWGYRETDALGGHDPYSASKAATELVVQSYRKSFFGNGPLLASARAGNVIGGGDWSTDRLIPDAVRAITAEKTLAIRSPKATRPWQHVLDCLDGYLLLARHLLEGKPECASSYNFGPETASNIAVEDLLSRFSTHWDALSWQCEQNSAAPHEAAVLYLDSSKARNELGWIPTWSVDQTVAETVEWYKVVAREQDEAINMTTRQIRAFRDRRNTA
ncbi:MAG: CDP-glucose 4,6-dehydratase [Pseudomonadota bacterium]